MARTKWGTIFGIAVALTLGSSTIVHGASDAELIRDCKSNLKLTGTKSDEASTALCTELARVASARDNVPVSPAFTVLNVTPDTVIRPRNPNDLATSVLNNVDPNGNFQQGLALDFNPYLLFAGDQVTLASYQNYTTRLLARTQFSLATTKGRENADKSARLALGLQVTPWLESDPKVLPVNSAGTSPPPLVNCMGGLFKTALNNAANPPPRSATQAQKLAHFQLLQKKASGVLNSEIYKECRERYRKAENNSSGWTLGLAPSWNSNSGDLDDLEWSGFSLWSSLALNLDASKVPGFSGVRGLGSLGQGILHIRYTMDEEVPIPDNAGLFLKQDSFILSGKFRFDGPAGKKSDVVQDMKFSFEGSLVDASREDDVDDTYYRWSADAEFRLPTIADNLWLVLSAGTTSGREMKNDTFAGASIKWGFTDVKKKKN